MSIKKLYPILRTKTVVAANEFSANACPARALLFLRLTRVSVPKIFLLQQIHPAAWPCIGRRSTRRFFPGRSAREYLAPNQDIF